MFDIIDFASEAELAVTVIGAGGDIVGIALHDQNNFASGGVFMTRQPDETDEQYSDRLQKFVEDHAAELGSKKAAHYSAKRFSVQMAEREKFFKKL